MVPHTHLRRAAVRVCAFGVLLGVITALNARLNGADLTLLLLWRVLLLALLVGPIALVELRAAERPVDERPRLAAAAAAFVLSVVLVPALVLQPDYARRVLFAGGIDQGIAYVADWLVRPSAVDTLVGFPLIVACATYVRLIDQTDTRRACAAFAVLALAFFGCELVAYSVRGGTWGAVIIDALKDTPASAFLAGVLLLGYAAADGVHAWWWRARETTDPA